MKKSKKKIIGFTVLTLVIILAGFSIYYLNSYYKATEDALECFGRNKSYKSIVADDRIEFMPISKKDNVGFIFYPGGKVDYKAYAPLTSKIAQGGYLTVIVKMPFNLAIFDSNAASKIIKDNPNIKKWVIGGHSLGGVMAARYAYNNKELIKGLIFWASYSDKDISKTQIKVLSIKGTRDGLISTKKYYETKNNLPKDTIFKLIIGGNHCNFGNYGFQNGDNISTISKIEQQRQTLSTTLLFLNKIAHNK